MAEFSHVFADFEKVRHSNRGLEFINENCCDSQIQKLSCLLIYLCNSVTL